MHTYVKEKVITAITVAAIFFSASCDSGLIIENEVIISPGSVMTFEKVPVVDSRVVRGYVGSPVDGSLKSYEFRGYWVSEYPDTLSDGFDASTGVWYWYNDNDGLHITLADGGFDAIVLRGGARAKVYADAGTLLEPENIAPFTVFGGNSDTEVRHTASRINTGKVDFFGVGDGTISDVGFFRISDKAPEGEPVVWPVANRIAEIKPPSSPFDITSISSAMDSLYYADSRTAYECALKGGKSETFNVSSTRLFQILTPPLNKDTGVTEVGIDLTVSGAQGQVTFDISFHDPLDPQLDLVWVRTVLDGDGSYRVILDGPDQVVYAGRRLWMTMRTDTDVTLDSPAMLVWQSTVDEAKPEALAWRKQIMRTLFSLLSECRPWGGYRNQTREEFYSINRYAALCPELFESIDICHNLAPGDNTVRQYREWVFYNNLDGSTPMPEIPGPPEGVPDWAWYPRKAWLVTRDIADWWMVNRMVPTGEFGGKVSDDSDMYQQYADLPYFEIDGTAARILDGAMRLAELTDKEFLRDGVNILTCDTLHAYEEGINHLALMSRWFYGDPIYLERSMVSARNIEKYTIVTPDGRRHFRDNRAMGWEDLHTPREPKIDGHATPLLWHTAQQVIDYNRNPLALKVVREWADSWLTFMKPGQWATAVDVMSGKITASSPDRPLYGGYSTQACCFTWLAYLTGESKYIEPFMYYYRRGEAPYPSNMFLGEIYTLGFLNGVVDDRTLNTITKENPALSVLRKNDTGPLFRAAIGNPSQLGASISNLSLAQRYPDMFTSAEQFDDRVFPDITQYASIAYLGGYTRRNKYNPTLAVSWDGFGTDYGALVYENTPSTMKAKLYNYTDTTMTGNATMWYLEHGMYHLLVGNDSGDDGSIDTISFEGTVELGKGMTFPVSLAPKTITIVELQQVERLDNLFDRADLAIAAREVTVNGTTITGTIHNIGSKSVADAVVAVVDNNGSEIARATVERLDAPLDLVPRRASFTIELPTKAVSGWMLKLDPGDDVPEIYEGNNTVSLSSIPAVDYARGFE
ncbi:hypothetical protein ACFL47_08085 [Candidatus Latescibacterota bacterium]